MALLHTTFKALFCRHTSFADAPWNIAAPGAVAVVDLDREEHAPDAIPLSAGLVVVGTTHLPIPTAITSPAANACDAIVHPDGPELSQIEDVVAANPVAATSLVMLLRASEHRTVGDGLLHESATYSTLQASAEFTTWRNSHPRRQRPPDANEIVRVSRVGSELTIELARPAVRNALNAQLRDGWLSALELAAADDSITLVHLRGEGASFCAGGDLDEFGTATDPGVAHLIRLRTSIGEAIHRIADRTVAHVHGHCAGSGIELPAFAGTVAADINATFALPEVGLGLIPGAGGTVSLPRRIGRHRTAELALSGKPISAATAHSWGLVDHLS